jgi:hypothetical protein
LVYFGLFIFIFTSLFSQYINKIEDERWCKNNFREQLARYKEWYNRLLHTKTAKLAIIQVGPSFPHYVVAETKPPREESEFVKWAMQKRATRIHIEDSEVVPVSETVSSKQYKLNNI